MENNLIDYFNCGPHEQIVESAQFYYNFHNYFIIILSKLFHNLFQQRSKVIMRVINPFALEAQKAIIVIFL